MEGAARKAEVLAAHGDVALGPRLRTRADLWALIALSAGFAVMLALSWQRWTHPIIDHGREMNLPARLLAGEQLYTDVRFLYGPLAPYVNAALYGVFGVHLAVLHASGILCAAMVLALVYWLARQLMTAWEAAVATALVLTVCAFKHTANFVQPYAYAAVYGLVLALASLAYLVRHVRGDGPRWLVISGLLAGLTLITKPEVAAAPLAAASVALLLESVVDRRVAWRNATSFALPLLLVAVLGYGLVLLRVPWRVLVDENHILFTSVPEQLVYFNRHVSGLAQWPASLWYTASGLGMLAIWAGVAALVGALAARSSEVDARARRTMIARAAGAIAAGLAWWLGLIALTGIHTDATPMTAAALLLPLLIGWLAWRVWRDGARRLSSTRTPSSVGTLVLLFAVFALLSLVRTLFNMRPKSPYAPFFLPVPLVVATYFSFRIAPPLFAPPGALRDAMRRTAMLGLALLALGIGIKSAHRFQTRRSFAITAPRGTLVAERKLAEPVAEAIDFVRARTAPGDPVLTLPQATSINFLAERPQPLPHEIVLPGLLTAQEEGRAIRRIEAHEPALILIVNQPMPEFRDRVFGVDYDRDLMRAIERSYRLVQRFDSEQSRGKPLGDENIFILAYAPSER